MHEHEARLDRLQATRVEAPRARSKLRLPATALAGAGPNRSGETVVTLDELIVGYPPGRRPAPDAGDGPSGDSRPLVTNAPTKVATAVWLAASRGDRIGIVGPNGAGKTTLLRTIAGELHPLDGRLVFGNAVQVGYLAQLRDAAIPGATVLDAILAAMPVTAGEARGYLARFLFQGDDVFKEVRLLSGGERSRLELALLGIMPSNLLLLDEPTNHLDIPAREAIEAFLASTPATILVVSHDRRLLETICDRLWVVDDGLAVPFDGGYRAWRSAIADGWTPAAAAKAEARRLHGGRSRIAEPARTPAAAKAAPPPPTSSSRRAGTAASRRGQRLSKDAYRRQKATVEAELTRLGLRKNHLELAASDPTVLANFVELRRITSELADVGAALEAAEEAWLETEERAP
jgi:ATP-binding cassette subfamily F protein 3